MSISSTELARIATLARLQLEPGEAESYARDLSAILDFVAQMDAVDTTGVAPLAHPLELPARLRADEVTEPDRREQFQALAPLVDKGLYLVPKVIE
ncbi:MAG: Asp-tRNA(Asn)/Glu-tRNA(Gln) amidotransferase subunit GatC [Gammaproteobacteria bacterium]|nr:Asp-tRNA(Asn)/Glu-tRNA(Gln) amidotransferase subunit GatC [Gammaproteobacteria bacterium]